MGEMKRVETLEKILKEINEKTAKLQRNKANRTTEELMVETYKILKKGINHKLFMVIKLMDELEN